MSIIEGNDDLQAAYVAGIPQIQAGSPAAVSSQPPDESAAEVRVRITIVVGLVVLGVICLVVKLLSPFDLIGDQSHGWILDRLLPRVQSLVESWSLGMMLFYPFGLLGIFLLERYFPAVPTQKTLSTGVVHDALWVLVRAAARLLFVTEYSRILYRVYVGHLSFLSLPVSDSLPLAARVVIAVLVSDFLQWFQHWLHHKVKWLWPFHAIHHAQRELNLFSETRFHSLEYLVRRPLSVLPMLMLGLSAPEVTWWLLLVSWHARLQHANIRSNFGPLRYLIVTPQSHRVHHSLRPEHVNHNYGSILSIWDYLFGTQIRDYHVYPETGIDDADFPAESAKSVLGVLGTVVRQLLYPFQRLWRMARAG